MVRLFLENKLKGLSYVALPRLFLVSYYFRTGSDGVGVGYPDKMGGGGGEEGQKSISPSRKTEKAFQLSSPGRPHSYSLCLCLLNFPIHFRFFSQFFFFFFCILVEKCDVWPEAPFCLPYTSLLICVNNKGILQSLMDCVNSLNTRWGGGHTLFITGFSPVCWNGIQNNSEYLNQITLNPIFWAL